MLKQIKLFVNIINGTSLPCITFICYGNFQLNFKQNLFFYLIPRKTELTFNFPRIGFRRIQFSFVLSFNFSFKLFFLTNTDKNDSIIKFHVPDNWKYIFFLEKNLVNTCIVYIKSQHIPDNFCAGIKNNFDMRLEMEETDFILISF